MNKLIVMLLLVAITPVNAKQNKVKQGEAEINIDGKSQTWTSNATVLGKNLGKQVASALNSSQGSAIKKQGENKAKKMVPNSADVKVSNSDVVNFAESFSGKTIYTSRGMAMGGEIYLNLIFVKGSEQLNISVITNDALDLDRTRVDSVTYSPDLNDAFKAYQSKKPTVTFDSIKRINDNALALSGNVTVEGMPFVDLMKNKTVDSKPTINKLSATFKMDYVPVKK